MRAGGATEIRFGPFQLDTQSGELRRDGRKIRLQDQPFQILVMLLDRPGQVVLREEIRQRLWPAGTLVEFDQSINSAVKRLRHALRDSADKPRYIETLARRGYRFVGEVDVASKGEPSKPAALPAVVPVELPPLTWRGRTAAAVVLGATALIASSSYLIYHRQARTRWAREVAIPQAARFIDAGNHAAAFPLIHRALETLPDDPELNRLRHEMATTISIRTTPPGAKMYLKPYGTPATEWTLLGQSPIEHFLLPFGYYRWKVTKNGFRTVENAAGIQNLVIVFLLDPEGSVPAGMVHVPRGNTRFFNLDAVRLDDFWIDQYEVTNRQFKQFVEQGGYRDPKYWRNPFVQSGVVISWQQAMAEFHDVTGRPGPSTWAVGDYPEGAGDHPVSGVSWYEAAAYAEFANKKIPTIHHWYRAAVQGIYSDVVLFSNFNGSGPAAVGRHAGLGAFGTYDMAGNVKEWCWNATGDRRYILGGSWKEGRHYYSGVDARSPFDRSPTNGFRCVQYPGGLPPDALSQPAEAPTRDHRAEKPVSDIEFRILQSVYSYDHTPLHAVKESVDESSPDWRAERITFDTAYDRQRMTAWLYLPRNAKPPFQTIVYFPAGQALQVGSIDDAEVHRITFLLKSGRAVLYPIYQGTYERRPVNPRGPNAVRDETIQQCKDLQRSIDYLETRTDIDLDHLGYYGVSFGARVGAIMLAEEKRLRAAVLSSGGLSSEARPPEVDEINFVPRVHVPVLMLNGRYDFRHPLDTDQGPMFRMLGTAQKDKRYVLFESGHYGPPQQDVKETLEWFDRYLSSR